MSRLNFIGWGMGFLVLAGLLTWAPTLLSETFTYYRWDNVEYYIPIFKWAHTLTSQGLLPAVNLHQHLGEPFATNIQAGVFYPIYSVAVALGRAIGASNEMLAALIVWLHLAIGLAGYFLLARAASLSVPLALGLAVLAQTAGFVMGYAGVWILIVAFAAWLPWCALGLRAFFQGKRWGAPLFILSYAMLGHIGNPQFWLYASVFLGLLALTWARWHPRVILRLALLFGIGVLLAMPTLLPVFAFRGETVRSGPLELSAFFAIPASWGALAGWLSPLWTINGGFLTQQAISVLTYQGPVAALALAFALFARPPGIERRQVYGTAAVTGLFLTFALGDNLPIYGWTHAIPIWSSLRWPSKFVLYVQFGVGILSIFGIRSLLTRLEVPTARPFVVAVSAAFALLWLVVLIAPSLRTDLALAPGGLLTAIAAIGIIALLPSLGRTRLQWAFFCLTVGSAVGTVSLIHDLDLKRYVESYDMEHGFDPGYRVMPTGRDLVQPYRLGRNNLALAATEGGYLSLTGLTHPVVARRYREVVPSGIFGAIPLDWIRWATNSRFLDFFAVRYALAIGPDHKVALEAASQLVPARESADVAIYENPDALPLSFLASATTAATDWSRDPRQVYVDSLDQHRWATGKITSTEFHEHGRIDIKLVTHGEALLVTSFLNYPGWQVRIDETAPSEPLTVNGLAMGVVVPAGIHRVSFRYYPPGLTAGLGLAVGGGLLFFALLARERRDARREP